MSMKRIGGFQFKLPKEVEVKEVKPPHTLTVDQIKELIRQLGGDPSFIDRLDSRINEIDQKIAKLEAEIEKLRAERISLIELRKRILGM